MNIRSFFDRVFFFSLLGPVKASTLDKLTEPKDMVTGVVKNINEGWMNSIILQLEAEDRTFYINRGIEKGLNVDSVALKPSLSEKWNCGLIEYFFTRTWL